jgi:hypothetical protein
VQEIGDFALYNEILGPIKIWKAKFQSDIKSDNKYLLTECPKEIEMAKQAF